MLALLVCFALAGCLNYTKPIAPPVPMTQQEKNFQDVWDASTQVLTKYYFTLDRQDRRARIITTTPLLGKGVAEFWRGDAATPRDAIESSLQTIYRAATITIAEAPERPGRYTASVQIDVTRSNLPSLQITSASEAYELFTMAGGRSRWLADYGRSDANEIEPEQTAPAADHKPVEQPTTQETRLKKSGPDRYSGVLGRDAALESKLASEIAALAAEKAGPPQTLRAATRPATQPAIGATPDAAAANNGAK